MSKVGNNPITIQNGIEIVLSERSILVKGIHGEITVPLIRDITVEQKENTLLVKRNNDSKKVKSLHGLTRTLIANAILGVQTPWKKTLEIIGTGFRVKPQGEDLRFEVGYSHPVIFVKPDGVDFKVEGNNKVTVIGINKQRVGEIAFKLRSIRKPDVYKGKGVRYEGEFIKLKPGKKAKTA